ncbi:MAG: hypothetical protein WCJ37_14625 [Syntrophus sp. (in: bacteria)]
MRLYPGTLRRRTNASAVAVVFFNKSYFGKSPHGEAFWVINLTGAKMNIPVLNTPVNDGRKLKAMILAEKELPLKLADRITNLLKQ